MNSIEAQRAGEALALALETAAFISPLPAEEVAPVASQDRLALASIVWRGTPGALVELLVAPEFGGYLAAAQLGVEEQAEEATLRGPDALKELMNVTAALLARDQLGPESHAPLVLGIPRYVEVSGPQAWREFTGDPRADILNADGHLLAIRIRNENGL